MAAGGSTSRRARLAAEIEPLERQRTGTRAPPKYSSPPASNGQVEKNSALVVKNRKIADRPPQSAANPSNPHESCHALGAGALCSRGSCARLGLSMAELDNILDDALAEFDEEDDEVGPAEPAATPATRGAEAKSGASGGAAPAGKPTFGPEPPVAKESKASSGSGSTQGSAGASAPPGLPPDFGAFLKELGAGDNAEMMAKMKEALGGLGELLGEVPGGGSAAAGQGGGAAGAGTGAAPAQANSLNEALKGLSEGLKDMPQQQKLSDEEALRTLFSELEKMDVGGDGKEGGAAGPAGGVLGDLFGNMMSKEFLYPAVKEIADKFPDFLKNSGSKYSSDEMAKYAEQHKTFKKLCALLENEGQSDETAKQVSEIMDKLDPPPQEIMAQLLPGFAFDDDGMPKLPMGDGAMKEGCSVM